MVKDRRRRKGSIAVDIKRLLIALFPKGWRETFGEEFAALLEDTRLTPTDVIDIVTQAGKTRLAAHRGVMSMFAALLTSASVEVIALRAGLTANILWAPTNLERALALVADVGPWIVLASFALVRHPEGHYGGAQKTVVE